MLWKLAALAQCISLQLLPFIDWLPCTNPPMHRLLLLPAACCCCCCYRRIAGIAIDAPWFRNMPVVNAYMSLLGAKVTWKNTHNIPQDARHVLVSNHISVGDLLVLFQQPQRYVHLITSALPPQVYATEHLPAILQPANKETYLAIAAAQQIRLEDQTAAQQSHAAPFQHLGLLGSAVAATTTTSGIRSTSSSSDDSQLGRSSSNGSRSSEEQQAAVGGAAAAALAAAASCRAAIAAVKDAPVHVFPEGGMTNGSGMMRFSRGFMLFADKLPVVPVALRVKTAFPEVKSHTLTSPFLANLFWFSFQPWTEIEAVALPPMQLQPGESKAAFVQRVQLAIAEELGVWVTDMNIQQKRSLMQKRQRQQQKRRARR